MMKMKPNFLSLTITLFISAFLITCPAIADVKKLIKKETAARIGGDEALQEQIDDEIPARIGGDEALQEHIDDEISARIGGDEALQEQIDAITNQHCVHGFVVGIDFDGTLICSEDVCSFPKQRAIQADGTIECMDPPPCPCWDDAIVKSFIDDSICPVSVSDQEKEHDPSSRYILIKAYLYVGGVGNNRYIYTPTFPTMGRTCWISDHLSTNPDHDQDPVFGLTEAEHAVCYQILLNNYNYACLSGL